MGGRGGASPTLSRVTQARRTHRPARHARSQAAAAPVPRPLTEDVPRIYPRRLPDPTRRELLRREPHHRQGGGDPLRPDRAPPAAHHPPGRRCPAAQLARPLRKSFQDLGGTFMKFGQIIASSPGMFGDDVADEFRACLDTGPPVPFPDVRQRVEEDLGLAAARRLRRVRARPDRHRLHRRGAPGPAARRAHGGGQGAAARASSTWWRPTSTSCSRCSRSWCARPATRWPAPPCSCSTASGCRSARRWTCATRRARCVHFRRLQNEFDLKLMAVPEPVPRPVGPQRADHGVLRRRPHRRPGPGGRPRLRPDAAGARGDAGLLPHHGALGRLPRRRARRQHDAAARRPHRRHRLGHRRAARPVDAPLLHFAAVGRHGRRVGLAGGDQAHHRRLRARPSAWPSACPTTSSPRSSAPSWSRR